VPFPHRYYLRLCRRLEEELGFKGAHVSYVTKFMYHARYQDVGSEREICAVLTTNISSSAKITPCEQETTEIRYMPPEALPDEENVSPWLLLALKKTHTSLPDELPGAVIRAVGEKSFT